MDPPNIDRELIQLKLADRLSRWLFNWSSVTGQDEVVSHETEVGVQSNSNQLALPNKEEPLQQGSGFSKGKAIISQAHSGVSSGVLSIVPIDSDCRSCPKRKESNASNNIVEVPIKIFESLTKKSRGTTSPSSILGLPPMGTPQGVSSMQQSEMIRSKLYIPKGSAEGRKKKVKNVVRSSSYKSSSILPAQFCLSDSVCFEGAAALPGKVINEDIVLE